MEHNRAKILEKGEERATKELIHGLLWVSTAVVLRLIVTTNMAPGTTMNAFLWAPIILGTVIVARGVFAHAYIWNRSQKLMEKAASDLEILERQP